MTRLKRRVSENGDVLCVLDLDPGSNSSVRLIVDEAALGNTLFSGSALRAKFTGNKEEAHSLARMMLAAPDLYDVLDDARESLLYLADSGAEVRPSLMAAIAAVMALAEGDAA